ncbi:hypothetical protein [Bacillus sp. S/N-304-OC-R1]|uniref:hypothetical protein n=1 Tax=Bacillus sp. S/N-304-OC-R1 TaxID=2758034 RepID=UPI001C8D610A|nr:hypothetical protein [Bacillus sp. S/N-304-OC-R1]MBY0124408.1 hypothetical protein [Bacillus sp. S/N-304-OC-R1]
MKKRELIELRNSLRRRGFWVDIVEGEFVLDSWFSRSNYYEMVSLLSSLKITLEAGNRGVRVKSNSSIPDEILSQIETATCDVFREYNTEVPLPILFQGISRNDLSISELDYGIASLVFSLNKVGLYTSMSCDGHGRQEAKMWFNGNQMEEVRNLLEMAKREISFAYDWDVKKETVGFLLIGRRRSASDPLDVGKVQDDALAFSEYLINNCSPTIS